MKTLEELNEEKGIKIENGKATVRLSPIPNWYSMVDIELSKEPVNCIRCHTPVKVHYPKSRNIFIAMPEAANEAFIEPGGCLVGIGHRFFEFICPNPECKLQQKWHNFD